MEKLLTIGKVLEANANAGKPQKAPEKYWHGSQICDSCISHCKDVGNGDLYDAKTRMGPWAVLCTDCFDAVGIGLGTGLGQKYAWSSDQKKYVKVAG
jgi:hypothetical protein